MAASRPSRALAAALYGGTAAAALVTPTLVERLSRRLPRAIAELVVTGAVVGGGFAAVAVVEQRRPYREDWSRSDGDEVTDLLHLAFGGSTSLLVGSIATAPIRSRLRHTNAGSVVNALPLPARLGVSILASDLYHWLLHTRVHAWQPLWRIHSVHHSARRLYSFNAGRFHAVQGTLVVIGDNVILAALGLDAAGAVSHRVFRAIFGQIQHSNVALDSGPLNAVLSTPERHRWHHSANLEEANTNFGDVVCVWDRLFGTAHLPIEVEMSGELGLSGIENFPEDFRGQCEIPFRWNRVTVSA